MDLSKTTLGKFNLYTIEAGDFKLDGGAMFGVVPKTLWSRGIPADEKNRIPMTMRCLLIQSTETDKLYLIDNGAGTKFNEKMEDIYQLDYAEKNIENSLAEHGFKPEDITDIIFTHLHFDHCGGTTYYDKEGDLQFTFPNATYHVQESHWETATHPNAREKASFLKDNIGPLSKSDNLHLIESDHEFEPGLTLSIVNGHTIGQQLPVLKDNDSEKTLVFVADLLPTHIHVPLPWVMGYDMHPVQTLSEKDAFLQQAAEQGWYLYLEHDSQEELIRIQNEDGRFKVSETLSLNDL